MLPLQPIFKHEKCFRRFVVNNRLPIAAALLALGFWLGLTHAGHQVGGWWIAWIPFLVAIIMVTAHFMVGPMTLIQGYIENGDMEGAQKLLNKVKYPNLLYKPVRSSYYMLRANMSTMGDDLDKAEEDLKKDWKPVCPKKSMKARHTCNGQHSLQERQY